jgi:hypothetical protein
MQYTATNKQILKLAAPISLSLLIPQISFMANAVFLGQLGQMELVVNGLTSIFYLLLTYIWIAEERNLTIPAHLYNAAAAEEWLRKFHFIETGETVHSTTISQHLQATVVYPLADKLQVLIRKYFAEGKTDAISGMLLCQESPVAQDTADITFLDKKVVLTIRSGSKLLNHQIAETGDINNLVYKIAAICREFGLKQDELRVSLSGLCITEETITELRSFFPKMNVPGSEQFSSFTLLSKLISCAS